MCVFVVCRRACGRESIQFNFKGETWKRKSKWVTIPQTVLKMNKSLSFQDKAKTDTETNFVVTTGVMTEVGHQTTSKPCV